MPKKTVTIDRPLIDPDKILKVVQGPKGLIFYLQGKKLEEAEVDNLKAEVANFKLTKLYGILFNTLGWEAEDVIMNKSKDFQDTLNGKLMLYSLDVMEKIMAKFK